MADRVDFLCKFGAVVGNGRLEPPESTLNITACKFILVRDAATRPRNVHRVPYALMQLPRESLA
jgi:hypothetical protein